MQSIRNRASLSGFTLVELLIVLAIFGLLMGMIFSSLSESQNASAIARDESEMNQNLQDVFSLMTTEMRAIGFPPAGYYDQSFLQDPGSPKNLVAQGLVEATSTVLKFQGDINSDKTVDYVHYYSEWQCCALFASPFRRQHQPGWFVAWRLGPEALGAARRFAVPIL